MTKARWWAIGILSVVTATVIILDATGIIFDSEPQAAPPQPLTFPAAETPMPALTPVDISAGASLPAKAERKLEQALDDEGLGPAVHALVMSTTEDGLINQRGEQAATPASTLKLLTAVSVLTNMDPDERLETSVVRDGDRAAITLVGGGDTTLRTEPPRGSTTPSLTELAEKTARKLLASGVKSVALHYDDSLFTGPPISPDWEKTYVTSGVIAPVTSLMTNEGLVSDSSLTRFPDPAEAAAQKFGELLAENGIKIPDAVERSTASSTMETVATVHSARLEALVQRMLRDSDNQLAESLGRLAALVAGLPASFDGAAAAIEQAADAADIDKAQILDASGLSRDNLVSPQSLVDVLSVASESELFRPILGGLPVAGFDGTLSDRFLEPPEDRGAGIVRAKTGTLTGISTIAGMTTTCAGELVFFAFLADEVPFDTEAAREALDRAATALTIC